MNESTTDYTDEEIGNMIEYMSLQDDFLNDLPVLALKELQVKRQTKERIKAHEEYLPDFNGLGIKSDGGNFVIWQQGFLSANEHNYIHCAVDDIDGMIEALQAIKAAHHQSLTVAHTKQQLAEWNKVTQ